MVTIHLHKLIVHGPHGLYEEERKVVNTFEVNLDVLYEENNARFNSLDDTISYDRLYEIVKQTMQEPVPLLEKICLEIIQKIRTVYPVSREINVSVFKLKVPMENFEGRVGVAINRKFEN